MAELTNYGVGAPIFIKGDLPNRVFIGDESPFAPSVWGSSPPFVMDLASGTLPDGRSISGLSLVGKYARAGTFGYCLRIADATGKSIQLQVQQLVVDVLGPEAAQFPEGSAGILPITGLAPGERVLSVSGGVAFTDNAITVPTNRSSYVVTTTLGRQLVVPVTISPPEG